MTARKATEPGLHAPAAPSRVDGLLALALVALLAGRMMVAETFESVELSFLDPAATRYGPTPTTTAWLDLLTLTLAAVGLLRVRLTRAAVVPGIALGGLLAAVAVSTFAAGDARRALLAGSNLFILALAGVILTSFARERSLRSLIVAAVVASGAAAALKCGLQATIEFQQTREMWEAWKQELVDQGADVDSPMIVNYERRLRSANTFGFLTHPNITAGCLAGTLVVVIGAVGAAWRLSRAQTSVATPRDYTVSPLPHGLGSEQRHGRGSEQKGGRDARVPQTERAHAEEGYGRDARTTREDARTTREDSRTTREDARTTRLDARSAPRAADESRQQAERLTALSAAAAIALGIAAVLPTTGSTGGVAAAAFGVGFCAVLMWRREAISARPARVFALLAGGYGLIIAAGATIGLSSGTLPHESLAFRWEYWTAAARTWLDAPLAGLGRLNFLDAYVKYKSAAATEEVRDPHNLWLSLLVELGPLGLLAGATLIATAVWQALRGFAVLRTTGGRDPRLLDVVMLAAGVLLTQVTASGAAASGGAMLYVWSVELASVWVLTFLAARWLVDRAGEAGGEAWVQAGATAAIAALLLHSLIDFILLTPAGLALFVLLAAAACGGTGGAAREIARGRAVRVGLALAALAAAGLYGEFNLRPMQRSAAALDSLSAALAAAQTEDARAAALAWADRAAAADRLDAQAALSAAQTVAQFSHDPRITDAQRRAELNKALELARLAAARNPKSAQALRVQAAILEQLASLAADWGETQRQRELEMQIAQVREAAVKLYPTEPRGRLAAGQAWLRVWRATEDAAACARARGHLEAARAIDATRKADVAVKLRAAEVEQIEEGLVELGDCGGYSRHETSDE